jgi:hypothetical protein
VAKRLKVLGKIAFVGLGFNGDMKISLGNLEVVKAADFPPSHRPTVAFTLAGNTLTYVNNATNLYENSFTPRHDGPAEVVNQITRCFKHDCKIDHNDIITFKDSYIAYWRGQP